MRTTLFLACAFLWNVGPSAEWGMGMAPGRLHRYIIQKEVGIRMKLLGVEKFQKERQSIVLKGFEQKLDHIGPFNKETWTQRYCENMQYYGENELIFLKIGGESDMSASFLTSISFMNRQAQKFKAAMFQLEHRFYGPDWPKPSLTVEALNFLSSDQALGDIAYFITQVNHAYKFRNPKWVLFGESYAGSLAAWARLKYPKLIFAAVASSAPLVAKTDFPQYYQAVTYSLTSIYGQKCTDAVKEAFKSMLSNIRNARTRQQYKTLFNLCSDIEDRANDIESFFECVATPFAEMVQFYWPSSKPPNIKSACDIMTNTAIKDPVARLAQVTKQTLAQYEKKCMTHKYSELIAHLKNPDLKVGGGRQWVWQTCSEFGWYQTSKMQTSAFGEIDVSLYTSMCKDLFGEQFDQSGVDWLTQTTNTQYKGYKIPVSNVVFVQGSFDPWYTLGIFMDPPEGSFAVFIKGTSHCADTFAAESFDPPGLQKAQIKISELLGAWLAGKSPKERKRTIQF